jgi:signal transduction histidine kinase
MRSVRASRASPGATALLLLTCGAAVLSFSLLALSWNRSLQDDLFAGVGGASFVVLSLASAMVGAMVLWRVPGNAVGWVLVAIGALTGAGAVAYQYGAYGLSQNPGAPGIAFAGWFSSPLSEPVAGLFGLVLVLFPSGRVLSGRWRPTVAVALGASALLVLSSTFVPGHLDAPFASLENPVGVGGTRAACDAADSIGWILAVISLALGGASAVHRLRTAWGDERQQLKLVLGVGAACALAIVLDMLTWFAWPHGYLAARMAVIGLSFTAFVSAAGAAILRYRLYDVDAAIERTLVYGGLTLLLAAAYGSTALVLGALLGAGSTWATAGATLVVALAFRPARAHLQDLVDRRFSRARHEAQQRIAGFLEDLRAARAEPEAIEPLIAELLGDPAFVLRYFVPGQDAYVDSLGHPDLRDPQDARVRRRIDRAGAPLALALHRAADPRQTATIEALLDAAILAIEMARLRVELRRHLAEVESSRARILAAGHSERRRIERDLHDGAQQRLVSIGLELRHAQHGIGRVPTAQTSDSLERAVSELGQAITELRDLAQGLPPSQLDAGLEPALKELAGRAPLPVEIRSTSERFDSALEATAYFIACEGLTNAIKHARANTVRVSATRRRDRLVIRIADDGIGGASTSAGSGLRGLSDRAATHGGHLHIDSKHNIGTILTAELPCVS